MSNAPPPLSDEEARRTCQHIKDIELLRHAKAAINCLDLQFPQAYSRVKNDEWGTAVEGDMKLIMVTGVVRLGFHHG